MTRGWWLLLVLGLLCLVGFAFVVAGTAKYEAYAPGHVSGDETARFDRERLAKLAVPEPEPAAAASPPVGAAGGDDVTIADAFDGIAGAALGDGYGSGNRDRRRMLAGEKGGRAAPVALDDKDAEEVTEEEGRMGATEDQRGLRAVRALEQGQHRVELRRGAEKNEPVAGTTEAEAEKPARFLPRVFYFENTYLGGNAAYQEQRRRLEQALGHRRLPHLAARLPPQPFDAPGDAGLALTASLDRGYVDRPGRVFLQVGLQGSSRFGWRRPPLDVVLVVDRSLVASPRRIPEAFGALAKRLGPRDRLGVVFAAERPLVLSTVQPVGPAKRATEAALKSLRRPGHAPAATLAHALRRAGELLQTAAGEEARVAGSQTVLLLTHGSEPARVRAATDAVHELTVQGAVTSVVDLAGGNSGWWSVAAAGHGNFHQAPGGAVEAAVEAELESLSRVIARLLRLNVRLAPGVEAIQVVGSRVLATAEVKRVKAREEATDRNLSKTLGVKADRGDDDDGIQTVIPYFYGGDSHVVLIELWVEKPGPVADVTLKYKDMVGLGNATARAAVSIGSLPRPETPAERAVSENVRGFELASALADASQRAHQGPGAVRDALRDARRLARGADNALLDGFEGALSMSPALLQESLAVASRRRIGESQ